MHRGRRGHLDRVWTRSRLASTLKAGSSTANALIGSTGVRRGVCKDGTDGKGGRAQLRMASENRKGFACSKQETDSKYTAPNCLVVCLTGFLDEDAKKKACWRWNAVGTRDDGTGGRGAAR
jgi:hypothetical protein